MFNKKVLVALANLIAILLLLKAAFVIVMYVWSFAGTPPVVIFDPRASQVINVLLLIQELGTSAFLYVITGAAAAMIMHKMQKEMPSSGSMAASRPARRPSSRRRTSKK